MERTHETRGFFTEEIVKETRDSFVGFKGKVFSTFFQRRKVENQTKKHFLRLVVLLQEKK